MTFSWDFNTATLLTIITQAVVIIWYLFKIKSDAREAKKDALAADDRAKRAHEHAEAAHIKLAGLVAEFSIHREHVAKEYVDKADLRELKDAIGGLRERIDTLLNRWHVDGKP